MLALVIGVRKKSSYNYRWCGRHFLSLSAVRLPIFGSYPAWKDLQPRTSSILYAIWYIFYALVDLVSSSCCRKGKVDSEAALTNLYVKFFTKSLFHIHTPPHLSRSTPLSPSSPLLLVQFAPSQWAFLSPADPFSASPSLLTTSRVLPHLKSSELKSE